MFDWNEYFIFSQQLFISDSLVDSEAKWRNVVSRSYYSVFHRAWAYLNENGRIKDSKKKIHEEVIDLLKEGKNGEQELGYRLDSLRWDRVKADYHDNYSGIGKKKAEQVIKDCNSIFSKFAEFTGIHQQ
jgi:uncharacterized protein (UPF0332 family)